MYAMCVCVRCACAQCGVRVRVQAAAVPALDHPEEDIGLYRATCSDEDEEAERIRGRDRKEEDAGIEEQAYIVR